MDEARGACLVGIDGGASTVRAWRLRRTGTHSLAAAAPARRRTIPFVPGFRPLPLRRQLAQRDAGEFRPAPRETAQAACVLEHALEVVGAAAGSRPAPLVLGVCMPGLQDSAGRGVLALRQGARLPGFLDALLRGLEERGLVLAVAPPRLLSDGRAAGLGEIHGAGGALRGVRDALYVAGGTGIAEALLLEGALLSTAALRRTQEPAWRLASPEGKPYEDLLSMAAINAAWARRSDGTGDRVEDAAVAGREGARAVLREAAHHLAAFLFARLASLHHRELVPAGRSLERIVLAQRTADLLADARLASCFADPLRNRLASHLAATDDAGMREAYLEGRELRRDLLVPSPLHAAPALGALAATLGWAGAGT